MIKQEIKFKPAGVNSFDDFKVDINKLIDILTASNSEWFLYCQSYNYGDIQFLPVTENDLSDDTYHLYKQNASFNNFKIGVIQFTNSDLDFTTIYQLLSELKHKTSDFTNMRR